MPRAKKQKTNIRKKEISQAAVEIILTKGPKALNIADIAGKVGIVPSAVYRHFPGKESVIDSLLCLLEERLMTNVDIVKQETPDPLEQLHRLLKRHVSLIAQYEYIPHVIFSDGLYGENPERKNTIREIIKSYLEEIENIARKGKRIGQIRTDVKPKTVSLLYLGAILPAAILQNVTNGSRDIRRRVEDVWKTLLRGIATEKALIRRQNDLKKK